MNKTFLQAGSFGMFLTVALGAFARHALEPHIGEKNLAIFEIGTQYMMMHALGLLAVGILATWNAGRKLEIAGWLMISGTVVFSGSLFALAISGIGLWGAVTPIGGVCYLVAWVLVGLDIPRVLASKT